MSTTLEPAQAQHDTRATESSATERLRTTMAATRVCFRWFGSTKSLSEQQKATAARSFEADGDFLNASKKLFNTRHPAYRKVTSVKNQITTFWKSETLPFPQPGLRLIRQDRIEQFDHRMDALRDELHLAVTDLDGEFGHLKESARQRLGELFNESDYPPSLDGMFGVTWNFPSVEAPDYLRRLNPELYRHEAERVARRFDEALEMAESAFMEELNQLVEHLTERLTGSVDGTPKVFRDSAITNLTAFFERFRRLNVRSNQDLDDLVANCQQIVQGRTPQSLRTNRLVRDSVAGELRQVGNQLDQLLVDRPRRNLIRRAR